MASMRRQTSSICWLDAPDFSQIVLFMFTNDGKARNFAVEFLDLPERQETRLGCLTVTAYPVVHASGAPAFALRVAVAGKVIGYSGDTEWTESLVEAARGADVFVCEAYFFEKRVRYHLDWRTLREQRHRLECRRLILTHMSQDMLGRLPLDGVECAEDGLTVTL